MDTITIIQDLLRLNGSADPVTVQLTEDQERLIAAAPDMYEALEELTGGLSESFYYAAAYDAPCHSGICDIEDCGRCGKELKAIRALAKARGETNE